MTWHAPSVKSWTDDRSDHRSIDPSPLRGWLKPGDEVLIEPVGDGELRLRTRWRLGADAVLANPFDLPG